MSGKPGKPAYERRRPEATALHQVVRDDPGKSQKWDDAVTRDAKLDSEPALAALAAASVTGTLPAGPALRRRDPIHLRSEAELLHTKALCATEGGFSLHAATTAWTRPATSSCGGPVS